MTRKAAFCREVRKERGDLLSPKGGSSWVHGQHPWFRGKGWYWNTFSVDREGVWTDRETWRMG